MAVWHPDFPAGIAGGRFIMLERYLRKWRLRGASNPGEPAPFVVGVGRSGTTMLRLMLDAHPQLAIPPETHFVPALIKACESWRVRPEQLLEAVVHDRNRRWRDFGLNEDELLERFRSIRPLNTSDVVRAFYRLYAEREGKSRWGDKTPDYVKRMGPIRRAVPEAHFVHLIRDGRDVALSLINRLRASGLKEPPPLPLAAERWKRQIGKARDSASRVQHYLEIRYEDMVLDTEPTLRRICDFIALDFDPVMLRYHERAEQRLRELGGDLPARDGKPHRPGSERLQAHALTKQPPKRERIAAWRTELSDADRAAYEAVAGDLLAELGYPVGGSVPS